jgi:hypothetical protein
MFFTLQVKSLYRFLNLVDGSWRNAVYVECTSCPFGQASCTGWLLAVSSDGTPILYDTELFCRQTGQRADKTECIAVISRQAFERLYKRWLLWNLSDPHRFPIRELAGN